MLRLLLPLNDRVSGPDLPIYVEHSFPLYLARQLSIPVVPLEKKGLSPSAWSLLGESAAPLILCVIQPYEWIAPTQSLLRLATLQPRQLAREGRSNCSARESSRLRDSSLSSLSDGLFQLFPTHTPTKLVRASLAATASSMDTSSSNPTSLGGPRLFYPALRTAIHYAVTAQPQRPYKTARGRLDQSLTILHTIC